ncbi:DUF6526 family protein [Robertkochia aurantiaca]|uniref:DUF6526 family protein n=1 Tax=Robertkochia aurantiaca TaxID=2873700 RepID=UPI001CCE1B04|nr:DUF6526 family protein [Robertkochia sp. 3YJGBD-33]
MKYFRIFEIVYLVIAVISVIEVVQLWNVNRDRAWIFVVFAVISIAMFLFRRHYRKKFQDRNKKD